jgi:hypothetical protein
MKYVTHLTDTERISHAWANRHLSPEYEDWRSLNDYPLALVLKPAPRNVSIKPSAWKAALIAIAIETAVAVSVWIIWVLR